MHMNVHSSFIHNHQKLKATTMPCDRRMDKQTHCDAFTQWNIIWQLKKKKKSYQAMKRHGGNINVYF